MKFYCFIYDNDKLTHLFYGENPLVFKGNNRYYDFNHEFLLKETYLGNKVNYVPNLSSIVFEDEDNYKEKLLRILMEGNYEHV